MARGFISLARYSQHNPMRSKLSPIMAGLSRIMALKQIHNSGIIFVVVPPRSFHNPLLLPPKGDGGSVRMRISRAAEALSAGIIHSLHMHLAETTMSGFPPNSPGPFAFPLELELHIFELAALARPVSIPNLMLVARHIKAL
jgi:hypothetical protein